MTGVTRFLVSVVGAALTLFVYGYALIEAERRLGYEAMHFLNYQLILLLFVPLFICAVWSVAPNVFRKFDRWSLVAGGSALLVTMLGYFAIWAFPLSCSAFGDCL